MTLEVTGEAMIQRLHALDISPNIFFHYSGTGGMTMSSTPHLSVLISITYQATRWNTVSLENRSLVSMSVTYTLIKML